MRPALTIYRRRRSARGVTDCSKGPSLRPYTDSGIIYSILSLYSPASITKSGKRATPCHVPRACLLILVVLSCVLDIPACS